MLARPEDEGGRRRRTARITAVVERANKTVTGVLVRHNRGCGSGRTVTGCPAPSRCSPSGRGAGRGSGRRGHDQLRKRQAPAHGYHAGGVRPRRDRESAVAALLYQYEIDREFPDAVMLEAKAAPRRWRRAPSPGGWTCGTRW
ncbi:hypothetical protein M5E87_12930 [Flavonifractor plautii]|nr:hypothetical protein M5E87_12930 [Flavonifractor plautii]